MAQTRWCSARARCCDRLCACPLKLRCSRMPPYSATPPFASSAASDRGGPDACRLVCLRSVFVLKVQILTFLLVVLQMCSLTW
eukprot:769896-Pleurochrysis_carterae.AAC.4